MTDPAAGRTVTRFAGARGRGGASTGLLGTRARSRAAQALAVAGTTLLVAASAAVAARPGRPITRVSGPSPYADCLVRTLSDESTFVNAEVEPWLAVDPADPRHLVGVWQQDRHSFGGARGLVSAYSFDRGRTWRETPLPFDACAPDGLDFERASDPWVSIGAEGTVYAISISWDVFASADGAVAAATSADGGATWNQPVIVHATSSKAGISDDKESITADPSRPGVAYATWTMFDFSSYPTAPLMFARTTDGGATWEEPRAIYETGRNTLTISSQIVVDPTTGDLFDVFDVLHGDRRWVKVVVSRDSGTTWSDPVKIARDRSIGVWHPNTGRRLRVGDQVPDAAIDTRTGDVYVVWEDSRFSDGRYEEIAMSRSTDGGRTWSRPHRANTATGLPAFLPSIEVSAHGLIGVSYYDVRDVGSAIDTLPTDVWLVKLRDGGRQRVGESKLAGPFDMMRAPSASGRFLGDYEGLGVSRTRFAALFAVANASRRNRSDIVFALG